MIDQEDNEIILKRSIIVRELAFPSEFVVYLHESYYNIRAENDPKAFS